MGKKMKWSNEGKMRQNIKKKAHTIDIYIYIPHIFNNIYPSKAEMPIEINTR